VHFRGGAPDTGVINQYFEARRAAGRKASTVASAIEIGEPVNLTKALRALELMKGVVRQVSDEEILDAKALVGRHGYGCEPASAASVAGYRILRQEGTISKSDRAVCILTGHALKDPDATVRYHSRQAASADGARFANAPRKVGANMAAIAQAMGK
jgi:threonine synthase